MSKGALIFAFNNAEYNYLKMADIAAGLVTKHLHIPTTVVTDTNSLMEHEVKYASIITAKSPTGNSRVFKLPTGLQTVDWKNFSRSDGYELSPYDQTLLIDSDYMVMTDALAHLFETNSNFNCFSEVYDLTGNDVFEKDSTLGKFSIPMIWATVMYFRKCEETEAIFNFVKLIRDNYKYYSALYNFPLRPFRNDFAFSVALHTLKGYGTDNTYKIPFRLPSLTSQARIIDFRAERCEFVYEYPMANKTYKYGLSKHRNMDIHIMNKQDACSEELLAKLEDYIHV